MHPKTLLWTVSAWKLVEAHSHVSHWIIGDDWHDGFNPESDNAAGVPAWSTTVVEDGWVGLEDYETANIVCHLNGKSPAAGIALDVTAGATVRAQWKGWPESHKGPVLSYIAYCGSSPSSCAEADAVTGLSFVRIEGDGLIDPDRKATPHSLANGFWATDDLIERNTSWPVTVPASLEDGYYVLRHELVALHYALEDGLGPQHYPQCVNLRVSGALGENKVSLVGQGVPATEMYRAQDPGLAYDIFEEKLEPYSLPGVDGVEDGELDESVESRKRGMGKRWFGLL